MAPETRATVMIAKVAWKAANDERRVRRTLWGRQKAVEAEVGRVDRPQPSMPAKVSGPALLKAIA